MNTRPTSKLLVYIFSDANFLSLNILENLVSKNCLVNIVCPDEKKWKERTLHLSNATRFSIIPEKKFKPSTQIEYAIVSSSFIKKEDSYSKLRSLQKQNYFTGAKTLALIPLEEFSLKESSSLTLSDKLGIVYLGDLLGPRIDLNSHLLINRTIGEALSSKSITFGIGEKLYPLFAPEVAKVITKWLLSFGPFGKEIFLLGDEVSGSDFWKTNDTLIKGIKLKFDKDIHFRTVPRNYEVKTISSNLSLYLSETYHHMAKEGREIVAPKILKPIKIPQRFISLSIVLIVVLAFPLICSAIATTIFFLGFQSMARGKDDNFQNSALLAKTFFTIGRAESEGLKYVPILGRVYKETSYVTSIGENISEASLVVPTLVRSSSNLFTKVLGNDVYDPSDDSTQIKVSLGSIYQNASTLEADTKDANEKGLITAGLISKKIDFEKIKNLSLQGETLASQLPQILGKDNRKTYLVLFQNNMELRPTGGFIGSYGTATFDSGRMIELNINDVYSADGQLRGHVEPPDPIKKYLGEANWWLRDSNWDPDFPTSAQRAEWFLDKEVDVQVDGVIGVDLSIVRDFLKYTGPIFLPDYNLDITAENLYEKTQAEVQDNFFPGSRQKASFLTALSRNLLVEITKLTGKNKILTLKSIFDNLEKRHVQIFLHSDVSQNAVSLLGWGGEVRSLDCGEDCYPDMIALVEANVGVNKANYFVSRTEALDVTYSPDVIERNFTIRLQNSANTALGASGRYKVYLRLFVPGDSEVESVKSVVGQSQQELTPEIVENKGRHEIGVLVEVLGGQSEDIVFNWKTPNPRTKGYALYIRKQAGVEGYPFTLTVNGKPIYNTTLDQDLWTRKF